MKILTSCAAALCITLCAPAFAQDSENAKPQRLIAACSQATG